MIQHHSIDYETKDKVFLFFIVVIATEIHAFKQYHTFLIFIVCICTGLKV
jgi:hypothetical protein